MRKSTIKAKLARNEPAMCVQLHFTDESVFELTSLLGLDGIWMDLEHHTYSLETATRMIRATRVNHCDIVGRAAKGELMRMSRLLEAGAHGIMYPRCDDAAEAAEVVKWAKFAPMGKRGFDGGNPDMPYCAFPMDEYMKLANEQTFIIIQLEEQAAVDRAEEIAAVPGVDVLFLGPADFTTLSGIPGQWEHPIVLKAFEKIAKAARKAGKSWGTPTFSPEHCKRLLDMGARFFCHNADIVMLKTGLERIQEQFSPLGFTYNNLLTGTGQSYLQE
jgi:4-hydroxy-2-oxoheptanedioate aldolase